MRSTQWRALVIAAAFVVLGTAGVAHAQCGPMDVVFAIDTTGSMGGAIDNVKADLPKIIDAVKSASGGDYRLGLLEVGGPQDGIVIDADMAAGNTAAIEAAINKFTAGGGAGEPEASDEAINTILHHFKSSDRPSTCTGGPCQVGDFNATFRPDATKVIILITDARPSGYDDVFDVTDEANVQKLATLAGSMGVHIGAIFVPTSAATAFGVTDTVVRIMQEWASLSSGIYLKANPDGTGTSTAINDIIASCGGAVGGSQSLVLNPTELALANGDTGAVTVQNFAPGNTKTLVYSANGLPSDSSITFTPVKTPDVQGTDQQTMNINIGPDTPAGVYIVNVTTSHSDSGGVQQNFVLVNVDCTPPLILGTGQPSNVANGRAIAVNPVGSLGLHYQWFQGSTGSTAFPIANATSSSFTPSQPGPYWVRVSNACGSTDSATATVNP